MRDEPIDGVVDNPWARRPGDLDQPPPPPPPDDRGVAVAPPVAVEAERVRSPTPRLGAARLAVWFAVAGSAIDLGGSALAWAETRSAIGDVPAGGATPLDALPLSSDAIDRLDLMTGLSGVATLVWGLATIVAAIFVLRWQAVAVRNQRALGIARPRYGVAAAGWSWFVPIWALFGPRRAYNDLWRASEPRDPSGIPDELWLARDTPTVFGVWWAAWIAASVSGALSWRVDDATLGGAASGYVLGMVSAVASIVAGALFVQVLEMISARHDARR